MSVEQTMCKSSLNAKTLAVLKRGGRYSAMDLVRELNVSPFTQITARIRDLRKAKHGCHNILCLRDADGVYRYELIGANNEAA
ncbi:hypothetical protein [Pseudoalteromonas piratica]|uniref:Helix-turn-helix type 11 domain-containing protein n=1 Tax=Pseudoalteromonas piratica TaxID=1348114 RepID=A0A0A7EF72_9GAMM|nr:hypothetical protein [Pseudoalteromonas piratica]AIY65178.1 hypothetical protein OM33_08420 [Pseudoalteromonas piratica]